MNALNVFAPHLLYVAGLTIVLLVLPRLSVIQAAGQFQALIYIVTVLIYTILFLVLVGFTPDQWIRDVPSQNWQKGASNTDTAIVLGFGYETDENGVMQPGQANKFLLDWVINNTSATTIFVQEGVWAAACSVSADHCSYSGRELKRIHQHDDQNYLNTLDSAFCAMEQMSILHKDNAVLVTHDLQLQRAAWDFERVTQKTDWSNFTFVIPEIPDTPYPTNSVHWQTRNQFIYKIAELLISRPRDYLSSVPTQCKAPLP